MQTALLTDQPVRAVIATAADDLVPGYSLLYGDELEQARASAEHMLGEALE